MKLAISHPQLCDADCSTHRGGEAMWHVGIGDDDAGKWLAVEYFRTHVDAATWLATEVERIATQRQVLDAPDHDGVVCMPYAFGRTVTAMPALAVRVRDASPLRGAPQVAAQVAERVMHARTLIEEAASLTEGAVGTHKPATSDWARLARSTARSVEMLQFYLACEVYAEAEPQPVAITPTRRLAAVPDLPGAAS